MYGSIGSEWMPETPKGKPAKNGAALPLSSSDPIIGGLRKLFDDVVNEPVPDEFLKILREIDKKSQSRPGSGGPGDGAQ